MTIGPRNRSRDLQDTVERGVWGELEYVAGAGAVLKVRGTGTVDDEVPLFNFGYGFNVPANSQNEMLMLSLGSDVNDKIAIPTLARDVQYPWPEGTGGVQNPTDPEKRIEFNGEEVWLKEGVFQFGNDKEHTITASGGNVEIETAAGHTLKIGADGTIEVAGALTIKASDIAFESGTLTHNGVNVGATHRHTDTPGLGSGTTSGPF